MLTAGTLAGCDPAEAPPPSEASRVDEYTGRGTLISLPTPGDASTSLSIQHEAIPGFKNEAGEVVGMPEMPMAFPLAEGVGIDGLAVGDAVTFDLRVSWGSDRGFAVTRLEKAE